MIYSKKKKKNVSSVQIDDRAMFISLLLGLIIGGIGCGSNNRDGGRRMLIIERRILVLLG